MWSHTYGNTSDTSLSFNILVESWNVENGSSAKHVRSLCVSDIPTRVWCPLTSHLRRFFVICKETSIAKWIGIGHGDKLKKNLFLLHFQALKVKEVV